MRTKIIIQGAIVMFLSCSSKKNSTDEEISGIKIISNFPVLDIKESQIRITGYDTFETRIYKYKNQVLIMSSYGFMNGASFKERNEDSILPKTEIRHKYFLYTSGEKTGFLFDSTKKIINKPVNADSMLNRQRKEDFQIKDLQSEADMRLVDSKKDSTSLDLIETYLIVSKKDSAMKGTIFFHYTNLNKFAGIDYSFSKELDNTHQMKLYKIVTINDAKFMGPPNNMYMDRSESFYLLEPISDFEDVKKYFNYKH